MDYPPIPPAVHKSGRFRGAASHASWRRRWRGCPRSHWWLLLWKGWRDGPSTRSYSGENTGAVVQPPGGRAVEVVRPAGLRAQPLLVHSDGPPDDEMSAFLYAGWPEAVACSAWRIGHSSASGFLYQSEETSTPRVLGHLSRQAGLPVRPGPPASQSTIRSFRLCGNHACAQVHSRVC